MITCTNVSGVPYRVLMNSCDFGMTAVRSLPSLSFNAIMLSTAAVASDDAALVAEFPNLYAARRETEDVVMAATRLVDEADALQVSCHAYFRSWLTRASN